MNGRATLILVIGGRSKIGAALIQEWWAGDSGSGCWPGPASARRPAGGAEAVTGDLADKGSLVAAMKGIDQVFLLSSPHPDAVSWHRNAIDAARRTESACWCAARYSAPTRSPRRNSLRAHNVTVTSGSGLPYVIVRPNLFLQNIQESTVPSIDASGNFYANAARPGSAWSIPATSPP